MHKNGIDTISCESLLEKNAGMVDIHKFELKHVKYSSHQVIYSKIKRYLDLSFVLVCLPVILMLSAFAAMYIYARDPGPVLFVQIRRGFRGRPFRMYKFRTMFRGASGGVTVVGDPRIIPGCSILRKLRIDELPQCYNVIRGEMSLIGPRPSAEYLAKSLVKMEAKYAYRCVVLPGITGWAQVNSGHVHNLDDEMIKLSQDLYYIKFLSFQLELVIFAKTLKTVLFGLGAK